MDVSVGILAYNEAAALGGLLEAVCRAGAGRHRLVDVVVYDDGSTDGTTEIAAAASARQPLIKLVRSSRRSGTMAGMAALARAAAGEAIVRMDADTMPAPNAIARLADAIANGAAVAVGGNDAHAERRTFSSVAALFASGVVERLKSQFPANYPVGRLVAYRTEGLRQLAFPVDIINEDQYAAASIVRAGGLALFEPAARCSYRVPLTFRDYSMQSRRILEGLRQLQRIGVARTPLPAVLAAVAAGARAAPLDALCWAVAYAVSCMRPAPAYPQPWPVAQTTKGEFAQDFAPPRG